VEYIRQELQPIKKLGISIECNRAFTKESEVEMLLQQGFDAVYIATGLWKAIRLNDKMPEGVYASMEFLAAMKTGEEDKLRKALNGKTVAVVGGGSVAMDCAETSVKLGAKDVYLIYRRSFLEMPAEEDEKQNVLNGGVHLLLLNQPVDYIEKNHKLAGIMLRRTKLGDADNSGRRKPEEIKGSEWQLDVDIVIEAIGNESGEIPGRVCPGVKASRGLIEAHPETGATSVSGIFAGGDVVNGPALIITAVRDGKKAAAAIHEFIINRR
jgi:glutamate synthase (NADPH) small chain